MSNTIRYNEKKAIKKCLLSYNNFSLLPEKYIDDVVRKIERRRGS